MLATRRNRVVADDHDDRDRARRGSHEWRDVPTQRQNHIRLGGHEFRRQIAEPLRLSSRAAVLDGDVAGLRVSEVGQPLTKRRDVRVSLWRTEQQHAQTRTSGLLRLACERRKNEIDCENDREPDQTHGHLG